MIERCEANAKDWMNQSGQIFSKNKMQKINLPSKTKNSRSNGTIVI